jgi:hypothetical protein
MAPELLRRGRALEDHGISAAEASGTVTRSRQIRRRTELAVVLTRKRIRDVEQLCDWCARVL